MSDLLQDLLLDDPEPTVAPLVVVDGLTRRYGRFVAVDNVSFQVRRGAIFGFVGPNGAGKTTTLKIMATLLEPTAGRVTLGGYEVTRRPAEVRNITGYMPDFFGVYDDLTVTEYLEFYARAQGVNLTARPRLLSDLLSLVDLGHKRDAYVETLSRGMKQRLCLARCLVQDAQILLLDEPASGLDPRARVEMRELLKELQRMGKTIIVSSHILPELADLCTDIGIVDRGHFLAGGTVEEVIRRYGQRTFLQIELTPENGHSLSSLLEKAVRVLQTQPGLPAEVTPTLDLAASRVTVPYSGSDSQLRQVLLALLRAGLPVIRFNLERGNLEDVFMAITAARPAPEEE